jgi:alpha-glucosidase
MSRLVALLVFMPFVLVSSTVIAQGSDSSLLQVTSPNGQIVLLLSGATASPSASAATNSLRYAVDFRGKRLMDDSLLGLKLEGQPPLGPGMHSVGAKQGAIDETYTIPVGKTSSVLNRCKTMHADFEDNNGRKLSIEVRAFDDGVAFRYIIPAPPAQAKLRIEHELTEFRYSKDATLYPLILDGFQSSYEDEYQMRHVTGIHHDWLIGLPLLAEVPAVGWVAVTEANIDNYAGMYLRKADTPLGLRAELSPRIDAPTIAVEAGTTVTSPWRVLMIGDDPGRLVESNIVLNLNPPSKIADTSWIRAGGRARRPQASASNPV